MGRSVSRKSHEEWLKRERLIHQAEKRAARRKVKSLGGQLYFTYTEKIARKQNG